MAATVRLATRSDVQLINLLVHELAEVEGMASGCKSTAAGLSNLLFSHAPFQGPTVFMLEVEESIKDESKEEEAMSGTVVTKPMAESLPMLGSESPVKTDATEGSSTASVELMLFRSVSNVKYKGRFFSEVSSPKHLQTNVETDMEEPVLEVFRSSSDVNLEDRDAPAASTGTPADVRQDCENKEAPDSEIIGEFSNFVDDPEVETFRAPCGDDDGSASRIVVGYVHVFPNFSTYVAKPGLYMEALYIRKPYRQLGLGKMLVKKIAKEAVKMGMERMDWGVLHSNDPAIKFYEGLGAPIKPGVRRCAIYDQAFANCEL